MSTKPLPTVGFVSLGCPKNLVDSEVMLGHLQSAGHQIVPDGEARVVLVNTCGFIDRAKEESVETILEQVERKKRGEIDRVIVAGCMVQKYGRELSIEIPEVDAFVGLDELENAPAAAMGLPTLPRFTDKPLATRLYDERAPRVLSRRRGYAYLKVGEGCDNPCTFCTIPQMRGLQRSRSIASLVAEARSLEAQGVSELVLISQDTTRYGEDLGAGRDGLARLVEALAAETSFPWIRFLYAYPKTLDDSVLELMAREPRFVPYVDIPLQHVSRPILAAMRRGGEAASYLKMIGRMRELVPAIAVRTTFIVGFPGEGDKEFRELCEFVREASLDNVGAFTYSPEPGSGSEPLGDPVAPRKRAPQGLPASSAADRPREAPPCAAGPRRDRRGARRRSTSTCSTAVCARRRPRSTGRSSSPTPAAAPCSRVRS
jgi:ribosomal protein S12 methylthiotransferase